MTVAEELGISARLPIGEGTASILIVDDHPPNLLALEGVLEPLGHRLVRATSGEEALKQLLLGDFALILLDVQMPGMNGFETAAHVKSHARLASIPIIFITAMSRDAAQIFRGYTAGAVDYLLKPYDPHILRSKVSVFIELHLKSRKIQDQAKQLHEQEMALLDQRNAARYRRLAECLPISMWAAAPDGNVYYSNRAWSDYSGQTVDEATTLTNHKIVHEDDIAEVRASWEESRENGRPFEMEYRLRRSIDGAYRWHLAKGVAERDDHGQIEGWIVTAIDIDDKKTAADAHDRLVKLEREAREHAAIANLTKDEFLATLSHEIRTPLNAILGWAQLLRTGDLDEASAAKAVATIERNAQAQGRLIEDLLDMQRIVTGKTRLFVKATDLRGVINAAVDSQRASAQTKGVRLSLELEKLLPYSGDPARLQQIVANLLSNAIKFTPKEGHVQVQLAQVDSGVEIKVTDDGSGIRSDFLPHVFERFRQADSTTTRTQGGLGLGLAIVRHLVELHGGRVRAESDGPGKGAVFTIRLPVRKSSERMRAVDPSKDNPTGLAGVEVLVVDDVPSASLRMALVNCGATVTVVGSAHGALESVQRRMPDVFLVDVALPRDDAYALVKKVTAHAARQGKGPPGAIAMTAFATGDERARALRAGFHTHLSKPIQPAELVFTITNLLRPGFETGTGGRD